jgi:hypothetical protein
VCTRTYIYASDPSAQHKSHFSTVILQSSKNLHIQSQGSSYNQRTQAPILPLRNSCLDLFRPVFRPFLSLTFVRLGS